MGYLLLGKVSKYSLAVIGFVIGTEIIYKCTVRLYAWLRKCTPDHQEYYKVIFFPDEGILALNNHTQKQSLNELKSSSGIQCHNLSSNDQTDTKVPCHPVLSSDTAVSPTSSSLGCKLSNTNIVNHSYLDNACDIINKSPFPYPSQSAIQQLEFTHTDESKRQGPLHKSTSLIHLISVLESAKKSLMVCVYLISCSDLLEAVIRAKVRGVKVRVILDKGMSSVSNISPLLQNRIPVRYSKPSQMMHNKFAVIDSPEVMDHTVMAFHIENTEHRDSEKVIASQNSSNISSINASDNVSHNIRLPSKSSSVNSDYNGILMTGSFNWTWSGVVNNHENIIITNNKRLVITFAEEFEKLWNAFEFVPPASN